MKSDDPAKFDLTSLKIIVTAIGLTIVVPLIVTNIINN
jgi:hypothetical protein